MHGLMTTTHIGIVHQIIMQQRKVVIGFQADGLSDDPLRVVLVEIVGQEH